MSLYRSSLVGYYQIVQLPIPNFAELYLTAYQRASPTVAFDELVTPDFVVSSQDDIPTLHLWSYARSNLSIGPISHPITDQRSYRSNLAFARQFNLDSTRMLQMLISYREIVRKQAILSRVVLTNLNDIVSTQSGILQFSSDIRFRDFVMSNLQSAARLEDTEAIVLCIETLLEFTTRIRTPSYRE